VSDRDVRAGLRRAAASLGRARARSAPCANAVASPAPHAHRAALDGLYDRRLPDGLYDRDEPQP